jgi:hypothetical protein
MSTEQKRISRLRKSLEPLAVLYEKAVLQTLKEPSEVRLKIQQSTDHLSESYSGEETVHIIDGESLRAAHEAWQEYRRLERDLLDQNGEALSDINEDEQLLDEPTYLSAQEREWLEWFYYLSDEDKKIVEECGENDITVTSDNFDEMKLTLEEQETKDSDSIVQLFKS